MQLVFENAAGHVLKNVAGHVFMNAAGHILENPAGDAFEKLCLTVEYGRSCITCYY